MNVYAYIVPIDDGAAPNPYGGVCTLAICKPNLRKIAQTNDWVLGFTSTQNRLIYAMKITQCLTMQEYDFYTQKHLPLKIPDLKSSNIQKHMGDSVYDFSDDIVLRKSVHSLCTKEIDLAGKNVLLSQYFYYFGNQPHILPEEFQNYVSSESDFIKLNQTLKDKFFVWLGHQSFELNKIYSDPHRIGIVSTNDRNNEMSCCIRKKIEKKFITQ